MESDAAELVRWSGVKLGWLLGASVACIHDSQYGHDGLANKEAAS